MTAYEVPGQRVTFKAGVDLTANRYKALVINANGDAVLAGADAVIVGVSQREAILGEPASVMINGITFGVLGGTVANGDKVSTDASGRFIKTVSGPVVGTCVFGGTVGQLGSILLK